MSTYSHGLLDSASRFLITDSLELLQTIESHCLTKLGVMGYHAHCLLASVHVKQHLGTFNNMLRNTAAHTSTTPK